MSNINHVNVSSCSASLTIRKFLLHSLPTRFFVSIAIVASFIIMTGMLFSLGVCVCVQRAVNNSSKTLKATDFKFDKHVPRNSPDMIP